LTSKTNGWAKCNGDQNDPKICHRELVRQTYCNDDAESISRQKAVVKSVRRYIEEPLVRQGFDVSYVAVLKECASNDVIPEFVGSKISANDEQQSNVIANTIKTSFASDPDMVVIVRTDQTFRKELPEFNGDVHDVLSVPWRRRKGPEPDQIHVVGKNRAKDAHSFFKTGKKYVSTHNIGDHVRNVTSIWPDPSKTGLSSGNSASCSLEYCSDLPYVDCNKHKPYDWEVCNLVH